MKKNKSSSYVAIWLSGYVIKLLVLLITIHLITNHCLYGAFLEHGGATKTGSLGRAGVAYVEDLESILVNPAGLIFSSDKQIGFEYQKYFYGLESAGDIPGYYPVNLNTGFVGAVLPLKKTGVFGFAWSNFSSARQYNENIFSLTYSGDPSVVFHFLEDEEWGSGINIKFLTVEYIKNSDVLELFEKYGNRVSGITFDFGLKYYFSEEHNGAIAFVIKNIYPVDIGLVKQETIPRELNFGLLYRLKSLKFVFELKTRTTQTTNEIIPCSGIESFLTNFLSIRTGLNPSEFTLGLGTSLGSIECNYCFVLPYRLVDIGTTHRIGLIFKWK